MKTWMMSMTWLGMAFGLIAGGVTLAAETEPAKPGAVAAAPGAADAAGVLVAGEPPTIHFTRGTEADFQALLDKMPEGAVVVCKQTEPLVVSKSLVIRKRMILRGLKANLPEKVGKTPILIVDAKGVALADLEMHGNYNSVR
ncbi:MAG TPA: hypothetical protein VMW52_05290, partial [Phycisphaerae bacterium]|nr:hypothetical protein [Phycisphaerae bacterium]